MNPLIAMTARQVVAALEAGDISHAEMLDALEVRIAEVDGAVNALPILCFDRARDRARAIAARPAGERGLLGGLALPIKDLTAVSGVRWTSGSPIFAERVAVASDHVVDRIEANGGVVCAKSNTPEFGAGASTFNPVFGQTANPWNTARSPAGSSGGAAAALAAGMAWVAQGSDMGGSLRSPASFCGVVGLRPSPGRVPTGPSTDPFGTLSVKGPMARNLGDLGLLLDAMAGPHATEPLALPAGSFRAAAEQPRPPRRVAFSPDLGIGPVDPQIARICTDAAVRFAETGAVVEEACPDFSGAMEAFHVLRAVDFATGLGPLLESHRERLKPDVVWNIERGLAVTGEEIARARRTRGRIAADVAAFMEGYDLLLCPTTIVPPFAVDARTVTDCAGVAFETYIDWLAIVSAITLTSAPALSLPCGFTDDGLPVGLQIVGRLRGEAALLSAAAALEEVLAIDTGPIDPRSP